MNKIKFLILALLILGPVIVSAEVPSFNKNFVKWTMCDQFNLTRWDCDAWWESETNPYYVAPVSNMTQYYNKTEIETVLEGRFYNKTEILTLASQDGFNLTTKDSYNQSEIDEMISEAKKWFLNKTDDFVLKDDYEHENTKTSDDSYQIVFIVIIVAVLGFGFYMYTQNKKSKTDKSMAQTGESSEMYALNQLAKNGALKEFLESKKEKPKIKEESNNPNE